jgi:hypothetical protein
MQASNVGHVQAGGGLIEHVDTPLFDLLQQYLYNISI